MMYLVRQQDPNTEKVGLISYSELLLHAVTKLSLWCFIGGRSAFITTRKCAKPIEVRPY